MTKILKIFFLACILMFSSAFSINDAPTLELNKHRLYVTRIDPEMHCFELSNKMVCCILKSFWAFEKLPEVGTEIYLFPMIRHVKRSNPEIEKADFFAEYSIDGVKDVLLVCMAPESKQNCLSYVSTKLVRTQETGWFYYGVDENVIELSDGSKWISKKVPDFKQGDLVVVTPCFDLSEWRIIDINQTFYFGNAGNLMEIFQTEEVIPYLEVTKE